MDRTGVMEKLTEVVQEVLDLDELTLSDGMTANDVEGWDSLGHVRVVLGTESAFRIRFGTSDMAALPNIGAFVDLIVKKIS